MPEYGVSIAEVAARVESCRLYVTKVPRTAGYAYRLWLGDVHNVLVESRLLFDSEDGSMVPLGEAGIWNNACRVMDSIAVNPGRVALLSIGDLLSLRDAVVPDGATWITPPSRELIRVVIGIAIARTSLLGDRDAEIILSDVISRVGAIAEHVYQNPLSHLWAERRNGTVYFSLPSLTTNWRCRQWLGNVARRIPLTFLQQTPDPEVVVWSPPVERVNINMRIGGPPVTPEAAGPNAVLPWEEL